MFLMRNKSILIAIFFAIRIVCMAQDTYRYRYWFDNNDVNNVMGETNTKNFQLNIDASQLTLGIHFLNFQVIDLYTEESVTKTEMFYRLPSYEKSYAVFSLDGNNDIQHPINTYNGLIHLDVDVSNIDLGLHSLQLRIVDDSGTSSSPSESFFLRIPSSYDIDNMKFYYFIDNNDGKKYEANVVNGFVHADVDLTSLTDGLHLITVLLSNDLGLTTQAKSAYFFKEPIGGNGIVSMIHWVNSDSESLVETQYDTPQSYIHLVDLLDLPHYPLRSSSFFFNVENDTPVIYPTNTLFVSFKDASGRYISSHRNYNDVTMRFPINNIEELNAIEDVVNLSKIEKDKISWRKISLEKGDSVVFMTNRACTIQLFDPHGIEVYNASGPKSVNYNGIYATSDGTYYIAVHDATYPDTDTQLSYKRIDKYTLFEHSPKNVGVFPGCFIITLDGNGYEDLKDIVLTRGNTKIYAHDVVSNNKAEAQALFYFDESTSYEFGQYDMELFFVDEDEKEDVVSVANAITLEEPNFGDFELTAHQDLTYHPTQRPHSTCVQLTISGTYTGNVNLQCLPIMIAVDNAEAFNSISFELEASNDFLETQQFGAKNIFHATELYSKFGDGYMIPFLIPNLQPYGSFETTMEVEVPDRSEFNVYTWSGTAWNISSYLNDPNSRKGVKRFTPEPTPLECYPDACDMIGDIGLDDVYTCICSTYTSLGLALGGIELATTYNGTRMVMNSAGVDEQWVRENCSTLYERQQRIRRRMVSPHDIVRRTLSHCRPELSNGEIRTIVRTMENVNGLMDALANDDCPNPRPHHALPVTAVDPNDIIGYVSESGTHYVGKNVNRLGYTIEFENDSTLATAAAHKINITDILPREFNLKDIHTRQIALGSKVLKVDYAGEFTTTIDLRPEINALAQLSLDINENTGEICYEFISLDPYKIEPVYDSMTGILPVNNSDGDGQGYIYFDIALEKAIDDGTIINNSASIVFDDGEAIETPIWHNETDYILPVSHIEDIQQLSERQIKIIFDGDDNRSGIWKYDLYCQQGTNCNWTLLAQDISEDSYDMEVQNDINYNFYVVATDKAGNKENKEPLSEFSYLNGMVSSNIQSILLDDRTQINSLYDILGRKVIGKPAPGIYILNGTKVILR